MEFNEKLQELRKRRGLTQEDLAEALYVSRTAISKWESGRGYPSIDSLKAIAGYFSVTIDDLLSGDEVLAIAEEDHKQKEMQSRDLVFGLLDCSCAIFFFLPFFGQRVDGIIHEVSLLSLTGVASYMRAAYFVVIVALILTGLLTFALQNSRWLFWIRNKSKVSVGFNAVGALLFILSLQPYAATLLFVFFVIKVFLLVHRR
jgi:transcriptional regulator with XRE-family HTH domain